MPALGHVYWRGFPRPQLVSINVDAHAATESAEKINEIRSLSGERMHYEKVVPAIGSMDLKHIKDTCREAPSVKLKDALEKSLIEEKAGKVAAGKRKSAR